MRKINVHLKQEERKSYPIFVGRGLLEKTNTLFNLKVFSKIIIVADKNLPPSLTKKIQGVLPKENHVVLLQFGEEEKHLKKVERIWAILKDFNCDRKSLLIALGGGVAGDVGGFAAATYMRGIDFLQVPTSLLSQVDASIGGKLGVNYLGIKNLIGTFQQPKGVIVDIETLTSLPKRELVSGFAEIIKHGLIIDRKYFEFVISKKPEDFSPDELVKIIERSCQIKAKIVSADEKESGLRKLLNFGHTIGHALEALSQEKGKPLLHGEAVALGMLAEAEISRLLSLLSNKTYKILKTAIAHAGLPAVYDIDINQTLEKIKSDKKNEKGKVNWTLLEDIGKGIYDQEVNAAIVRKALTVLEKGGSNENSGN